MENPESLIPPRSLVEKWKADAYRDHGCAFQAYDAVLEAAAKWGYQQALKEVRNIIATIDTKDEETHQTPGATSGGVGQ